MPSTRPTVGLLFDVEALQRQNEVSRKQAHKRRIEAKKEEILQEQANLAESKVKRKNSRGKDLISRRKAAQLAQMSRAAKMTFKKTGALEKSQVAHKDLTLDETEELAKTTSGKEANEAKKTSKENELNKAEQSKNIFADVDPELMAKVVSDISDIQDRAKVENWPELDLDLSPGKSVLDQLLNPKNLVGSTATAEELKEAKSMAKLISRFARQTMRSSLPTMLDAAAKALAKKGIDLTDPEMNPYRLNDEGKLINPDPKPLFVGKKLESNYFQVPNQANPDAKISIDHSIFASVFKAIEINQLLQELGIKSEIVAAKVQKEMSEELIQESKEQYEKNAEQIRKSKEQDCASEALRIFGDVVGALFIYIGMPYIGVPIILASEGKIKEMISAMAKAFGVPEYVIQSIITAIAVTIAIVVTVASSPVPGANAAVTTMAWSMAIMVAGMVGWFETTVGAIATGQLNPEKFPGWVIWAAMGIEISLSLIVMYKSIISAARAVKEAVMNIPKAISNLGTKMTNWGTQISTRWAAAGGLNGMRASAVAGFKGAVTSLKSFSAAATLGKLGNAAKSTLSSVTSNVSSKFEQFSNYVSKLAQSFEKRVTQVAQKVASNAGSGGQIGGQGGSVGSSSVSGVSSSVSTNSTTASVSSSAAGQSSASGSSAASSSASSGAVSATSGGANGPPAQVRENLQNMAEQVVKQTDQTKGISIAAVNPSASSPAGAVDAAVKVEKGVLTKLQEVLSKLQEKLKDLILKLLEKLLKLKDWAMGAESAASHAAGAAKGAASTAERAEKLFNSIKRLIRLSQSVAKWLLLAAQGAQAAVQIEMGRIQLEMAEILEEAAELAGEITFIQQFLKSINLSISSLQESKKEYAQDSADQIEQLGSILISQRRNENLLMSA